MERAALIVKPSLSVVGGVPGVEVVARVTGVEVVAGVPGVEVVAGVPGVEVVAGVPEVEVEAGVPEVRGASVGTEGAIKITLWAWLIHSALQQSLYSGVALKIQVVRLKCDSVHSYRLTAQFCVHYMLVIYMKNDIASR